MLKYKTGSYKETQKIGEEVAARVIASKKQETGKQAVVIALAGDLGAGKTTFTQGFLRGLNIKHRAVSPTFIIMRRYGVTRKKRQGTRKTYFKNLYHFDAYRLKKAEDLEALEFKIILMNPENIILIEWPENIKKILPQKTIWIKFQYGKKENERVINYEG